MSCLPANPTFRLLDAFVGWDPDDFPGATGGLIGFDEATGIRLEGDEKGVIPTGSAQRWLPPAWVSRGCGPCEFWLATKDRGLRYRGPCDDCFVTVWEGPLPDEEPPELVAVAASGQRVAILEPDGRGWILLASTLQTLARFEVPDARLLAFNRRGELLVVYGDDGIAVLGPDGDLRIDPYRSPPTGQILGIAEDDDDRVWVKVEEAGRVQLLSSDAPDEPWTPRTLAELAGEVVDHQVVAAGDDGFCVSVPGDGQELVSCWDRDGCPSGEPGLADDARALRLGQLLTLPIDSGIRRCEWHRVRARVSVPEGTQLEIAVASTQELLPEPVDPAPAPWVAFSDGRAHVRDWQIIDVDPGAALVDALIDQPPGRYLYVRIRMVSRSTATPVVQQVRLDMPRVTAAAHLPAVYDDDPEAADFTRRFLSLFDATVESHDAAIERMPALLDVARAPGPVLPWLAALYDIDLDSEWTEEQRRALLTEAPLLARVRGTPEGIRRTIELAFPNEDWETHQAVIRELGLERPWGGVGASALVGSVRLFGRSRARVRLGTSALGSAPVQSFGDPQQDSVNAIAGRFEVIVPPLRGWDLVELQSRIQRLIDAIKPAHTVGVVRVGGAGLTVGMASAVGIDTLSVAPPPAVLGQSVRLGRSGVLGRGTPGPDWRVGRGTVGCHTVVE